MHAKAQICVIGLGKFGYQFGITLIHSGYNVIGIDITPGNIERAKNILSQVYEADASNKIALEQIGLSEITHVLVSVGDDVAASAMTTMHLKEFGIPNVLVKAINEDHARLLKKIGADKVIIPEHLAAAHLADTIDMPGIIQRLPFDEEMIIQEFVVDELAEKTIREIDLTNTLSCQILAIRKHEDLSLGYIPKADDKLTKGDVIILIGKESALVKIRP